MSSCPSCGSSENKWVGYSTRVQRSCSRPSADVLKCLDCGHTWRYARTGRPITTKKYQEITECAD